MSLPVKLAGSSKSQRWKIERFDLSHYFQYILVEGEFGVGRPDEKVYLHTLQTLDLQPQETWMVGDRLDWDVIAPQRLGISGVWIDSSGAGVPEDCLPKPHRVIRRLEELV